jgi:alanine dehydrogenase
MKIGVAKEIKSDEYRVALTPAGARELADAGHDVFIEQGAGEGSAFPDDAYQAVGAQIVSVDDVWADAELLLKVKEPIDAEYGRLRDGLVLFTYLHLAADEGLTNALVESGISAVAYETVETSNRALPLLAPMSEIAGRLAAQAGAYFLEKPLGGRGLLLGGVPGVAPGQVMVIGGGMVGYNSAVIALGLGANVTIIERSIDRMRHLEEVLGGRVTLLMSSSLQIEESVADADVVIGAVLIPGAVAPKLVTRAMVAGMKEGSVIADVAIDQGGCFETARPTTHSEPVYVVDGVTHYCVANMPGAVPITATKALTNATLPYVEAIATHGLPEAVARDSGLARGVNVLDGKVTTTRRSRTSYRCRRSDRLRALGLRLLVLLREEPHDEPRHSGRERRDHDDEEDEAEQSEDRVHDQPRIAPCPAHASSCWMRWARESFPTQPSSATKDQTHSAMSRGRSAVWTCPTSRPSASATSSRSRAAPRNRGLRPSPAASSNGRRGRTRPQATGS